MRKEKTSRRSLLTDKPWLLLMVSICMYAMIYFYHGFMAFGSDTIETVPYALWMADNSLFPSDFHIQYFSTIFPNERWLISWLLHFFPNHIFQASFFFHFAFSVTLISGMIRLSDLLLKNLEWSVLAVFLTLFSLYDINTGSNELYYNMFVSSLAAKAIAVWAIVFWFRKVSWKGGLMLGFATILHPLVGLQIFVLLLTATLIHKWVKWNNVSYKNLILWIGVFLLTGGIWVALILKGQHSETGDTSEFFRIVEFRIAHHFFPNYFPVKHIILLGSLIAIALLPLYHYARYFFTITMVALLGVVIYILGLEYEIELFLSSQWMKTTIWLKFFAIIGLLLWAQKILERKWHQMFFLIGFAGALILALLRFHPQYDKQPASDLYAWIQLNTSSDDLFLVPPQLVDFKAKARRSSYFDFKAMLHHQPAIFEWARRFEEVYGMKIGDRVPTDDIFSKVRNSYAKGSVMQQNKEIDYFIVPFDEADLTSLKIMEKEGRKPVFLAEEYAVYGKE